MSCNGLIVYAMVFHVLFMVDDEKSCVHICFEYLLHNDYLLNYALYVMSNTLWVWQQSTEDILSASDRVSLSGLTLLRLRFDMQDAALQRWWRLQALTTD